MGKTSIKNIIQKGVKISISLILFLRVGAFSKHFIKIELKISITNINPTRPNSAAICK